jgi:signal transduction histidine kinase
LLRERYSDQLAGTGDLYLGFIETGIGRLSRLIEDLLSYARVGAGAHCRLISSESALRSALDGLRHLILETQASVTYGAMPQVRGDEQLLAKVFQNLVENAIKYHGENPPSIRISADIQNEFCTFRVQDNGIGIDPIHHQEIFAPLRRLRGNQSGTGMGLALCKAMIEQMGGRIWVNSYAGEGATFYFCLPTRDN